MARPDLIEKVATAIEQCGWEEADIMDMNEVMAKAALAAVYAALLDNARQAGDSRVIEWLAASPINDAGPQG